MGLFARSRDVDAGERFTDGARIPHRHPSLAAHSPVAPRKQRGRLPAHVGYLPPVKSTERRGRRHPSAREAIEHGSLAHRSVEVLLFVEPQKEASPRKLEREVRVYAAASDTLERTKIPKPVE